MNTPPDPSLFALMAERVQDYAIFLLDPEGRIRSWNAGARHIKQYAPQDIIGKHFSVFYTEEDRNRDWPGFELKRAMMDGRFEDDGWRVRKDGSRFWANVIITALRDDAGTLLGFSKITRDLTDARRQQERLRQSEERFRLLVDGVQDYALFMLSPEGVVTSWNSGARRINGYEAAEIVGLHFSRFFTSEAILAGKPWSELAIARETGRAEDEGWRVRKDGTRFWAKVAVTALHDADGELRGFAKVTQDLTLKRHSEALENAARQINDFLAVLAHELRNPLAPIRYAVELMRDIRPGDADFETMRMALDRQSGQLARIVDDLLDVGRITRGNFEVHRHALDLGEIVARAIEAAKPGMDAARHELELELPAEPVAVEADDLRLTQAFTNILNNAVQYTDPGGRISVSLRREGSRGAAVSIRDTGQGIEPHLLGSVFGMFVQGRREAARARGGLGVGLALARTIVELHHGSIEARSAGAGKGSEFVVRLPALERAAAAQQAPAAVKAPSTPARRVLVVDDNVDAATMLCSLMKSLGHEVIAVHDGAEALKVSEGYRPELIMLDIGMPGMSGYEVARRLRERERGPRPMIVAVTGWGHAEDRERAREAGFDEHLVKPVAEEQLRRVLGESAAGRTS